MDTTYREARMQLDEMRLQMATQLDPQSAENLFTDNRSALEGSDEFQLMVNLRLVSQYNFEQIKERIRGFTTTVLDHTDQNLEEFQPFVN